MFGSLGQYFLLLVSVLLWGVFKTEPQTYLKPSMEGLILVLFQLCYMDCGLLPRGEDPIARASGVPVDFPHVTLDRSLFEWARALLVL